jgi:hypothetical protein
LETYASLVTFALSTDFKTVVGAFALNAGGLMRDEGESSVFEPKFDTGLIFVGVGMPWPGAVDRGLSFDTVFFVSFFGNAGGWCITSSVSFDVVLCGGDGADAFAVGFFNPVLPVIVVRDVTGADMTDRVFSVLFAAGRARLILGGSLMRCVGRDCVEWLEPFELVESERACCFASFRTVGRLIREGVDGFTNSEPGFFLASLLWS